MSWGAVAGAAVSVVGGSLLSKGARGRASGLDKKAVQMADDMSARADDFAEYAKEQWTFYKTYGQGIDIALIGDAMKRYKKGPAEAVTRASADVNTAYDRAAAIRERQLGRYGGPGTGAALELSGRNELDRARAEVEARNRGRRQEEDIGFSRLMAASAIGQQSMNNMMRMSSIETDMRGQALSGYTGGAQRAASEAGNIGAFVGDIAERIPWGNLFGAGASGSFAANAYGHSAEGNQGAYEPGALPSAVEMQPPMDDAGYARGGLVERQRPMQIPRGTSGPITPRGQPMRPAGPVAFASGGMVRPPAIPVAGREVMGPGTGTSDSVPAVVDGQQRAALSTGEFVIPAEVVRKKGTEFFEKLIQSTMAQPKGAV